MVAVYCRHEKGKITHRVGQLARDLPQRISKENGDIAERRDINWLEKQIEERRFSNISHGIEYAIYQLMKKETKKE